MSNIFFFSIALISLLLAACSTPAPTPTPTPVPPTETPLPTLTAVPTATNTATPVSPTATATNTPTVRATATTTRAVTATRTQTPSACAAAESCFQLGETLSDKKDWDNAIVMYTRAIQLKPDYGDAYFSRGASYCMKKDKDKAQADLNALRELARKSPQYIALSAGLAGIISGLNDCR